MPRQPKEPVVYAVDVRSPDGKRVAVVRHDGNTYDLEVGPAGGGPRRTLYRSAYISTTSSGPPHTCSPSAPTTRSTPST